MSATLKFDWPYSCYTQGICTQHHLKVKNTDFVLIHNNYLPSSSELDESEDDPDEEPDDEEEDPVDEDEELEDLQ